MQVAIGADHRGLDLKEKIKTHGYDAKITWVDVGAHNLDPNDDYPDTARLLIEKMQGADNTNHETSGKVSLGFSIGVLICGSGVGMVIAANKFPGIRAGLGLNPDQVRAARHDDDMNILVLAADYVSIKDATEMTAVFLQTKFSDEEKHVRRLNKITALEKKIN